MPVQYTNRAGKTYTLFEGKTKIGKPRYFFSNRVDDQSRQGKAKGEPLEQIPPGYEIYERPENGQVFLCKSRVVLIGDDEKQLVERSIKRFKPDGDYLVDVLDNFIIIYELPSNTAATTTEPETKGGEPAAKSTSWQYQAVCRFELVDEASRLFRFQRFYFRRARDAWMTFGDDDSLENLTAKDYTATKDVF